MISRHHLRSLHMQHFACFACRKGFKQQGSELTDAWEKRPFSCPECGASMVVMGRDFQAPRQSNRTEWLVAELLHSFGFDFEPGTYGPGYRPRRMPEAVEFLTAKGQELDVVKVRVRQIKDKRSKGAKPS